MRRSCQAPRHEGQDGQGQVVCLGSTLAISGLLGWLWHLGPMCSGVKGGLGRGSSCGTKEPGLAPQSRVMVSFKIWRSPSVILFSV